MFETKEELFEVTIKLVQNLETYGFDTEAKEIREYLNLLKINGLTDDWGLFLESVERVYKVCFNKLNQDEHKAFQLIRETAYFAVYRKRLKPMGKFW